MHSRYFTTFLFIIGALLAGCQPSEERVHKESKKEAKESVKGMKTETHSAKESTFSLQDPHKKFWPTKHRITYSRPIFENPGEDLLIKDE